MRECVGKSYYEDSVLVKCDCGQHIMEVFIFKPSNNFSEFELGIEWHSSLLKKSKFPDFYFLSYSDFELFVHTITGLANDITPFDEPIKLYTMVTLKNNKSKRNGRLEINSDDYGYVNFLRYNKFERGKLIWDLSIHQKYLKELSDKLDQMLIKIN